MIKILLTSVFSFAVLLCSAQQKLLTYQDLQQIVQSKPALATTFLQQKDYHLQGSANDKDLRFFGLYSDSDYTDISLSLNTKHNYIHLSTTHLPQVELIQKSLQTIQPKNSRGAKIYRVKDEAISTVSFTENEPKVNTNKVYTIELIAN